MRNSGLKALESRVSEMTLRMEHLQNLQSIADDLKENFTSLRYERRYSHVGPRTQRTKFYRSSHVSDSTVYRMKNRVAETTGGMYTVARTGYGDVAVYFNNKF